MRFTACTTCRHIYQVGGDLDEVQSLLGANKEWACITPLCKGRLTVVHLRDIPVGWTTKNIPVKNFFRAIHGFGPGEGEPASLNRAREIFLTEKIVDVIAESVGQPQRVILRELVTESGIRLHFETSSRGACLYYIEEPGPTCVEVVEDELNRERDDRGEAVTQSGSAHREEAGRGAEAQPEDGAEARAVSHSTRPAEDVQPNSIPVPAVPDDGRVSNHRPSSAGGRFA